MSQTRIKSSHVRDDKSKDRDGQGAISKTAFANRLRSIIAASSMKDADFARAASISTSTLSRYTSGQSLPGSEQLFSFCDALGVNPRWLITGEGSASTAPESASDLLDRVEQRLDEDAAAARAEMKALEQIALDSDLIPELRANADYILEHLGDAAARKRRRAAIKKHEKTSTYARETIENVLDAAMRDAGIVLGDGLRTAILALCGQLLFMRPEDVHPDLMAWSLQSLVQAIVDRIDNAASYGAVTREAGAALQDHRAGYRGPRKGER